MQSDTATKLSTEGDASIGNDQILHLTNADQSQTESIGRVSYREPFLLRQNSTGKLADFTTNFTFVINPPDNGGYGLVFFLAPNGSLLNRDLGKGGSMGLPVNSTMENPIRPEYAFVAVEFDTYQNQEPTVQDPLGQHIGIDVNSLDSTAYQKWNKFNGGTSTMIAQQNSATISYDSVSKNLSVSLITSYVLEGTPAPMKTSSNLYLIVDLEKYLPGRVIVGFSAATDSNTFHNIISWNFTSTLLVDPEPLPSSSPQVPVSPNMAPASLTTSGQASQNQAQIPSPGPSSIAKSKKQNILVLIAAAIFSTIGVFFLLGGFIWFIFWIKNRAPGESNTDEHPMIRDPTDEQFGRETGPRQFSYRELEVATVSERDGSTCCQAINGPSQFAKTSELSNKGF
ncbi:anti-H(O) lectin 1-like [Rosa rugosa]|uniref:anti-H(O) lectin 1-like n=1 Tax=Rosa rugosa TaxID=74645 RepID=UPI002B401149|nr:anti-H(O) lectin 1-like [Rosa rugosa]